MNSSLRNNGIIVIELPPRRKCIQGNLNKMMSFSILPTILYWCVCAKSLQLCPTLYDPTDCSLQGSSVHGISQAWTLEWVAISFSRGSSWPRGWIRVSLSPALAGGFLTTNPHMGETALILRETWCYGVHSSFEGKKVSSQLLRGSLFWVSFSMILCTLTFCSNETLNTHIVCDFRVAKPTTLWSIPT